MTDSVAYTGVPELLSQMRYGRTILLLLDNSEGDATGIVTVAAELCEPECITFLARQARGLVCLGLTRERCEHLNLPLMVEGGEGSTDAAVSFTLSIEAANGIDTGISAADRARTVRAAVAPSAVAADLVQPGHIFPVAAASGGLLIRADKAEAATDLAALAGLMPAAVFAEVLNAEGNIAHGNELIEFARCHELSIGRVSDLVTYRLNNECTIERIRTGTIETAYGPMTLIVYRELNMQTLHLALSVGELVADKPIQVRVHVASVLRDLVGTTLDGQVSWRFDSSLRAIAESGCGVLVLITRPESPEELLASVDRIFGRPVAEPPVAVEGYALVGLGAQILRDLGVGRVRLMGAQLKYNALAGFGLEVVDFILAE